MHEYGIARDIVRQAAAEAKGCGAGRITALRLRVGPGAAVDLEALIFGIQAAASGTVAEGAVVELAEAPGSGIILVSLEVEEAA